MLVLPVPHTAQGAFEIGSISAAHEQASVRVARAAMLDSLRGSQTIMHSCPLIVEPDLPITVVYIVVTNGPNAPSYVPRFVQTYLANPPGEDHDLVICCNGGPLPSYLRDHFKKVPCHFFPRGNDSGYDISAYQEIARHTRSEMMVCLGESAYFHRPGWLKRFADVWRKYGMGMYGVFASHSPNAHLGTTLFAVSPEFLTRYPPVTNHQERYAFEHGPHALWRRVVAAKLPAMLVTWDGEWKPGQWRMPDNCYWRGDQSNCIIWANHTDRFANSAGPETKRQWSAQADAPFK